MILSPRTAVVLAGLALLPATSALACAGAECTYRPVSSAYAFVPPATYAPAVDAPNPCASCVPAYAYAPPEAVTVSGEFSGGVGDTGGGSGGGGGGGGPSGDFVVQGYGDVSSFTSSHAQAWAQATAQAQSNANAKSGANASAYANATTNVTTNVNVNVAQKTGFRFTGGNWGHGGGGWGKGGQGGWKPKTGSGCGCGRKG